MQLLSVDRLYVWNLQISRSRSDNAFSALNAVSCELRKTKVVGCLIGCGTNLLSMVGIVLGSLNVPEWLCGQNAWCAFDQLSCLPAQQISSPRRHSMAPNAEVPAEVLSVDPESTTLFLASRETTL